MYIYMYMRIYTFRENIHSWNWLENREMFILSYVGDFFRIIKTKIENQKEATTLGIPRRSPIQVLTKPDVA